MHQNITIESIEFIDNQIVSGRLPADICTFGINPDKETGHFNVKWTFQFNLANDTHIVHISRTVFAAAGFDIDMLMPQDPRIDIIVQLVQMALAHSRTIFYNLNHDAVDVIPPIIWRQELIEKIIAQLNSLLN